MQISPAVMEVNHLQTLSTEASEQNQHVPEFVNDHERFRSLQ